MIRDLFNDFSEGYCEKCEAVCDMNEMAATAIAMNGVGMTMFNGVYPGTIA